MSHVSDFVLTEEMVEQYYREGYFYARNLITKETVDAINKENGPIVNEEGDRKWTSKVIRIQDEKEQYPETTNFLT